MWWIIVDFQAKLSIVQAKPVLITHARIVVIPRAIANLMSMLGFALCPTHTTLGTTFPGTDHSKPCHHKNQASPSAKMGIQQMLSVPCPDRNSYRHFHSLRPGPSLHVF